MTWTFQYYNGSAWVNKTDAMLDQIIDELNGQLELDFIIPKTPYDKRDKIREHNN